MIEKLDMSSPDLVNANFEKLAALFPNCVTESAEGKAIDFDLLKQELSHAVVEGSKERYRLEWPGKKEAIVTANIPSTKTLRPVRADSVDFDNTENIYIEGDNLEVLKLLQESYLGKIKMIYIDPPYNTGKDFIYKDNFAKDTRQELEESGQVDEYNQRLVVNPETAGRYHSDWLSMMYPRLKLARNLLREDGVIFISIDDNESQNLRKLCDEILGENNFVADVCVVNNLKGRNDKRYIATANERLFMYVKSDQYQECGLRLPDERLNEFNNQDEIGKYRELGLRKRGGADTREKRPHMFFPLYINPVNGEVSIDWSKDFAIEVFPRKSDGSDGCWRWGKVTTKLRLKNLIGRAVSGSIKWDVFEKDYLETEGELRKIKPKSVFFGSAYSTDRATKEYRSLFADADFPSPKSVSMLIDIIEYSVPADSNEIVLDFFSGSAATAHAIIEINTDQNGNRRFIMVQLPETTDEKSEAFKAGYKNICEIGKERIRRAAKAIVNEKQAEIIKKQEQLEKMISGPLSMVNGQWVFPEGRIIEDTAREMLDEMNQLQLGLNNLDTGFRVYRLDTSNMQDVYYRPQDYKQEELALFADNIKPDRSPDDLLAQIMLDWGLPLSLKIEQISIQGKQVFKVAGDSLYACFDKGIDEAFAKEIARHKPLRIVFRDSGFKDDTAKTNVKQLLRQLSPETEMRVI
ncbi:MAG: site-specific DNA-methyltransferase [Lentimicrobiaceae bacterium]|nr:site-specific DNA-methyltransferase [Lentimicrobiaceae bacterium]